MTRLYDRRQVLWRLLVAGGSTPLLAAAARGDEATKHAAMADAATTDAATTDSATSFDPELPIRRAKELAGKPFHKVPSAIPKSLADMSYDDYVAIKPRRDRRIWRDAGLEFRVDPLPLGYYYRRPATIYEVVDGKARRIVFDPDRFTYGSDEIKKAAAGITGGYAGFRVFYAADWTRDFMSFQGASYFRAVGGSKQYGLSARGLAVDVSKFGSEEVPRFTTFWLERPASDADTLTIHALLDSARITGAYRFRATPGGTTTMDVEAKLFARKPVDDLGIAPLTSMFYYGENDYAHRDDFRPEIHDSDGLCLERGNGERIWRPLRNPEAPAVSVLQGDNPKGFGLCQRDRNFDHYQDDGIFYDRRPNLWVEPQGGWGNGDVVLVELPAKDETEDNIVAYWRPKEGIRPDQPLEISYRLFWGARLPRPDLGKATIVATRTGRGGIPGEPDRPHSTKFVIDFKGGVLPMLAKGTKVVPKVTVSRGEVHRVAARPLLEGGGWRMNFDVAAKPGGPPVELRAYLSFDGRNLTETWLYQWQPPTG